MEKFVWPSLTPCKRLRRTGIKENDRLTQLPNDVLFSIMSRLSTKEASIHSVLSHKWNELWACYPGILNFEDSATEEERYARLYKYDTKSQDTCNFVMWVTHVVKQHVSPSLEGFKVAFDLDNTYQSDIDKWVVFALSKGVKSLELEFCPSKRYYSKSDYYSMPFKCCMAFKSPLNLPIGLKTLVLDHMEITTTVLECFLQSCLFLENLRISCVTSLQKIRASHSLLALKHLDVFDCELKIIDILAPKLSTFRYLGRSIQLNIRNALSLSEVSIGDFMRSDVNGTPEIIEYAFDSLSEYFPHLEYLHLSCCIAFQTNLVIPAVSNLSNLKHLRLSIKAFHAQSLFGWITLIEASHVLEKFTLELTTFNIHPEKSFKKRTSPRPLEFLRTFEVYGFVGRRIDLELMTYVLENAVALEEVIVDFNVFFGRDRHTKVHQARAKAMELKEKLPVGAKLVIKTNYEMD